MSPHPYIAIEGAIGVGKTTLARILGEALPAELLLEVFEENPFLSDFYADRARYAFQTQIFFLLSRYRQQHSVIAKTLQHSALVSDYLFAKDWLFAHLNLAGDELQMYERVHAILGEQIPTPSLVVYLRASVDVLMQRIAFRDRSYERRIERDYIAALSQAYDRFFAEYTAAPVLTLDTDDLDIVSDVSARNAVIARVKEALGTGLYQLPLLELPIESEPQVASEAGVRLHDFQRLQRALTRQAELSADLFFNYFWLTEEVGRLGRALKQAWRQQEQLLPRTGNRLEAHQRALSSVQTDLSEALSDALACLFKIADDAGIDLEKASMARLRQNWQQANDKKTRSERNGQS